MALVAEGGFQGLKLRLERERLADDFAAIKAVRGAVGENINTRELKTPSSARTSMARGLSDTIHAGAGDYIMPDLIRIAGVTGWLRAAAIAGAADVEMSTQLYPQIAGHLMRFHRNRALARMAGLG